MIPHEEGQFRLVIIETDVKSLQETVYGHRDYIGLLTRIQVLETRLQLFWWVLAAVGSAAISLVVRTIFKSMG